MHRPLNKALKREHFQLPTLDDLQPELADSKVFSTLDLRDGFWQVKLDEANNVSDLEGVINKADDLLVIGKGKTMEEATVDHDIKLRELLQRCRDRGMRLNAGKLNLRQTSISFLGHMITSDGSLPDPEKVETIKEMPCPTDVKGVQRLGRFVNYLAKFLPHISDVMAPIRNLVKANVSWTWSQIHDEAFGKIKKLVSEAPVLRYYDSKRSLVIQCDASEKGMGTALLQEGQPLAYISRALTDTETRYAQIEKELLALVYACERFHQYTFGRQITVLTDHRPLEAIMKKELGKCPKRLQNMLMRLQAYDATVLYHPGKMFLADTLSRAYIHGVNQEWVDDEDDVKEAEYIPVTERRLLELRSATKEDRSMQQLQQVIVEGWLEDKIHLDPEVRPYFSMRNEMTVQDGLIFRGNRVVVLMIQRTVLKEKLHSTHLGIEGCCRRARECLYWPNMNSDIRDYVSKCPTYRKYEVANPAEPLMVDKVPDRPWENVGVDLFKFSDRDYLCTVDYMSNFWEIDHLQNTEAKTVIFFYLCKKVVFYTYTCQSIQ